MTIPALTVSGHKTRKAGSKLKCPEVVLRLPPWVAGFLAESGQTYPTVEARMKLAVALARQNIEHKTGGPFGAAIFERDSGRLVAVGVNQVEASNCSVSHAEILAIAMAQCVVGSYDLGSRENSAYELVTSTEPCVMCLGAVCWSGVRQVVCGARDEDAREIGFDEGPKPPDWVSSLESRGISVVKDVLREHAKAVLAEYQQGGGLIYNSRQPNA
jgi:tRNA(Arg) A34 adenosine deaminase TadA